jgi:hypothetical protein
LSTAAATSRHGWRSADLEARGDLDLLLLRIVDKARSSQIRTISVLLVW